MTKHDEARQRLEQQRAELQQRITGIQRAERDETAQGETDNAHEWENADVREDLAREARLSPESTTEPTAPVRAVESRSTASASRHYPKLFSAPSAPNGVDELTRGRHLRSLHGGRHARPATPAAAGQRGLRHHDRVPGSENQMLLSTGRISTFQ